LSQPKEHPIIFSGESVRAILAGEKTQTRRTVRTQPSDAAASAGVIASASDSNGLWSWLDSTDLMDAGIVGDAFRCPYGVPGDRLWVRETFALEDCREVGWYEPPHHDGRPIRVEQAAESETWWIQPHYRATDRPPDLCDPRHDGEPGPCWRSPLFMSRWASRLTLEIDSVRIERLQEISEEDAEAEGVTMEEALRWKVPNQRDVYHEVWECLNGKRAPWNSNPWVWVVTFSRMPQASEVAS
jgi:hypothetical protein